MEFVDMLNDRCLLTGFLELLADPDHKIVKKTSRVASGLYQNTLRLMTLRNIDNNVVDESWPIILKLTNTLMEMISTSDNEGITFALVHFTEQAVGSHLTNDVSAYPIVSSAGRDIVKKGLKVLKDLVSTPYVGGIVFNTAMRSLVRLACLRPDLYEPVSDLVKKQMDNLPPTLFDHNVRSLHKMLQRNLFRLLRRSTDSAHKKKLIELMVTVGVPRKIMAPWAPPGVSIKRPSPPLQQHPVLAKKPRYDIEPTNKPEKKPLSGFELLTSLIPKQSFCMYEAEKCISEKLTMENVCSIIIANLSKVPDEMPHDFSKQFSERTIVGEIADMRKRLASLLADTFDGTQLKKLVGSSKSDSSVPVVEKSPISSNQSKDIDMRLQMPCNRVDVSQSKVPENAPVNVQMNRMLEKPNQRISPPVVSNSGNLNQGGNMSSNYYVQAAGSPVTQQVNDSTMNQESKDPRRRNTPPMTLQSRRQDIPISKQSKNSSEISTNPFGQNSLPLNQQTTDNRLMDQDSRDPRRRDSPPRNQPSRDPRRRDSPPMNRHHQEISMGQQSTDSRRRDSPPGNQPSTDFRRRDSPSGNQPSTDPRRRDSPPGNQPSADPRRRDSPPMNRHHQEISMGQQSRDPRRRDSPPMNQQFRNSQFQENHMGQQIRDPHRRDMLFMNQQNTGQHHTEIFQNQNRPSLLGEHPMSMHYKQRMPMFHQPMRQWDRPRNNRSNGRPSHML